MRRSVLVTLGVFLSTGCPPRQSSPAAAAAKSVAGEQRGPGAEPAEDIKPVYAGKGTADPLATRLCELFDVVPVKRQAACCQQPKEPPTLVNECVRVVSLALADKHVVLDAQKVTACEAAYRQQLTSCDRVGSTVTPLPAACEGLFTGSLEVGAVCRSNLECSKGLSCVGLGPTDSGKCEPPAAAHSPCRFSVDPLAVYGRQDLADHQGCAGYCNRSQCADLVPIGEACSFDAQCGVKNHCSAKRCVAGAHVELGAKCEGLEDCPLDALCAAGICTARGATGAACERDEQCLGECDRAGASGHCGPRCPHSFPGMFTHPPTK